jgi:hypothetical protein
MSDRLPQQGQNWRCPYCGRDQVVLNERRSKDLDAIDNDSSARGPIAFLVETIACANEDCRRLTLTFALYKRLGRPTYGEWKFGEHIDRWQLWPESFAKPQPDYIPEPIRQDYTEACRIRDLSPKASATLARRCLQGMIRDFCKIAKPRLIEEIKELRQKVNDGKAPPGVQADTMEAIDHVRSIGNIGAHMEKDINVMVDVDEGEAQALIELVELLLDEWYVARQIRAGKISRVGVVAAQKAQAKQGMPQRQPEEPPQQVK